MEGEESCGGRGGGGRYSFGLLNKKLSVIVIYGSFVPQIQCVYIYLYMLLDCTEIYVFNLPVGLGGMIQYETNKGTCAEF